MKKKRKTKKRKEKKRNEKKRKEKNLLLLTSHAPTHTVRHTHTHTHTHTQTNGIGRTTGDESKSQHHAGHVRSQDHENLSFIPQF